MNRLLLMLFSVLLGSSLALQIAEAAPVPPINLKPDVVYKTTPEGDLHLDLYYPETELSGKYPVVIYTHGGGWAAGSKKSARARTGMSKVVRGLTEKGFCVASVDYRLCKKDGNIAIRDCVIDAKDAIRFLSKNSEKYSVDTDRAFTFGDSAGGQIAQMLLLSSPESLPGAEELKGYGYTMVAGVSWYGPCDFEKTELFNHDGRANFRDRFGPRILGPNTDPADKLRLYREVSPVNYLTKESPPLLMIQADKDTTIPVHHAHYMKERAEAVGAPFEMVIVKHAGHNWRKADGVTKIDPPLTEIVQRTVNFIKEQPMTAATSSSSPNVVVILTDDHRADYLGCQGHPIVKTPNVDRLAAEGIRFENAFAVTAACTPNRTCLLTGQYERKHGVTFGSASSLTEEAFQETYPMLLRKAGYYVGYVGKNHTPMGNEGGINKRPEDTLEKLAEAKPKWGYHNGVMEAGFDYWYGNHNHSYFYPKALHPIYRNARVNTQVEIFEEGVLNFLKPDPEFAGTQEFLRTKPKGKPFCLLVNFNVPHGAGTSSMKQLPGDPELYRTTYRDQIDEMPIPETYIAMADIKTPKIPKHVYNGKYIKTYNYVQNEADLRERLVRTCQTVTGVDRLVGNLVAELKEQGVYENTVIVFTSDHGLLFGEHGLGGKVLLYEDSIRVPLVVFDPRLPESRRGAVAQELALSIDIAPTLLELAGVSIPAEMQGKSLKPVLKEDKPPWREDFFCENMFMGQNYPRMEGVRSKDFKYIRYFDKKKDKKHIIALTASIVGEEPIYEELYDLVNDPKELKNLADSEDHQEILAQYRTRCKELVVEAKGGEDYPKTYRMPHMRRGGK